MRRIHARRGKHGDAEASVLEPIGVVSAQSQIQTQNQIQSNMKGCMSRLARGIKRRVTLNKKNKKQSEVLLLGNVSNSSVIDGIDIEASVFDNLIIKEKKSNNRRSSGSKNSGDRPEAGRALLSATQVRHVTAMTIARVGAQCLIHPLDTIKTRLQVDNPGKKLSKYLRKARDDPILIKLNGASLSYIKRLKLGAGKMSLILHRQAQVPINAVGVRRSAVTCIPRSGILRMAKSFRGAHLTLGNVLATGGELRVMDNYLVKGVRDLYRGLPVMFFGTIPWYFLYGAVYESTTTLLKGNQLLGEDKVDGSNSTIKHSVCAITGLMASSFARVPADSIRHKIQIRDKQCKNGIDCVKKIWRQKGINGFYRGFFPTMMRDVLEQSLALNLYNMMRKRVIISRNERKISRMKGLQTLGGPSKYCPSDNDGKAMDEKLGTPVHLALGMLSGGISAFITAPLDVVKTRLQCGSTSQNRIGRVLMELRTENGIRSLFAGTRPRIMQQALLFSAYFCMYEWFKLVLKSEDVRDENDKDVIHKIFYKKRTKILKSLNVPVV